MCVSVAESLQKRWFTGERLIKPGLLSLAYQDADL